MRAEEEMRLQRELGKLEEQIDALSPELRHQRSERIRETLVASGKWLDPDDAQALEAFVRGELGLIQLAEHFNGRI